MSESTNPLAVVSCCLRVSLCIERCRSLSQDAYQFHGRHSLHGLAQRRLGLLSERGDGVRKDYVQAYIWYELGAANGGNTGAIMRDASYG